MVEEECLSEASAYRSEAVMTALTFLVSPFESSSIRRDYWFV